MKKTYLLMIGLVMLSLQGWSDPLGDSERTNTASWVNLHEGHVADTQASPPDILFIGDSITDYFDRDTDADYGMSTWTNYYEPRNAYNAGIGGDKVEDLRWRVENGLFDGTIDPKVVVMLIGANGHDASDTEANKVAGMRLIVDHILTNTVATELLLLTTFPAGESFLNDRQGIVDGLNAWPLETRLTILNINNAFLATSTTLNTNLFRDGLHPNAQGYEVWHDNMEPTLVSLLDSAIGTSVDSLNVSEGSTNTFTVHLVVQPSAVTTVSVGRVTGGDTNIHVSSGSSLIFTTNNWSTGQVVIVTADSDDDWADDTAIVRCSAPGLRSKDVSITVIDDETDPDQALPFTETFETLATGALLGQHGWASGGAVQTSTVHSGSRALSLTNETASHTFADNPTNVWVTLWAKPVFSEDAGDIPADASAFFYVNTNSEVVAYSNTTAITLETPTVSNGWNKFEVECDYSSKVWKLSLNGIELFDDFAFYSDQAAFSAIELVEGTAGTGFFDDLEIIDSQTDSDTDGDDLPDWWEIKYFGGATNANPLVIASNGVNTVEDAYIAGLNPNDPDDFFLISDLSSLTSESILQWQNASGRVYSIYWTSNLVNGFGSPWETNITDGVFTDTTHSAEVKGFYKLEVELAE